MNHSRAYLLLEREYMEFTEANIFGISITPVTDNLMKWVAEIEGLKDSLWECAVLQISMNYTEGYNNIPPCINFITIPFHPNVDPQSGRPCVDFLDDPTMWNSKLTMTSILLSIQVLLSNPVLNNAVNLEAAKMLQDNYPLYRQRVIQCVRTSQYLKAQPSFKDSAISFKCHQTSEEYFPAQRRKITAISYEDYYLTWFEIATSKAREDFKTPVFEDPNFIGNCYNWFAENVAKGEWDENMYRFIISECIEKQKRQKLLDSQTGSHHISSSTPVGSQTTSALEFKKKDGSQDEEQWEKEAEDLVLWSTSLDQRRWD
ncbi:ubiquitin-conjugating enzyme E2 U [Varanus komodoensis]|uniref:ubiquitin-conjugating enzyme E2 U n=1 Tax=Varanus komodoensis TaxID=61221 RepID=UPI001CF7C767|nr:ubiquitin-conjugating enzyme E2 U [Varanus komodoensis]